MKGNIVEIFSAPKGFKGDTRPIVKSLVLEKDYGIQGDKFALKNLDRTVMIVGTPTYEFAKENGIELKYGSLGENILFDFDPHLLEIGTIIIMGDAKIQITQKCTICTHLAVFGENLPTLIQDCRGLYCKIVESGIVNKNTKVIVD